MIDVLGLFRDRASLLSAGFGIALTFFVVPLSAQSRLASPAPPTSGKPEFEHIVAVRELRDGSVLLVDRRENGLFHLPSLAAAPRRIGRVGSGPLEYRSAGHVWALGGDSSLFIDEYTGRWLMVHGTEFVGQFSESRASNILLRSRSDGASIRGDIVGLRPTRFRAGVTRTENTADSLAVVRVRVASEGADTIAFVAGHGAGGVTRIPARGDRPAYHIDFNPLSAAEQVLLHQDGWLSVVRLAPYRVDWRRPDGVWIRGRALRETPRPVTRAEQCDAIARIFPVDFLACDPGMFSGWPTMVPPVLWRIRTAEPTLQSLPQGRLAIARTPALGDRRRPYDVVDRRGERVGTIALALGEALVGSSARYAYVAYTDEDGLQTLRRYEWPPLVRARGP